MVRVDPNKIIYLFKDLGDVKLVAERIGIHPATVYRWIKKSRTSRGYLKHTGLKRRPTKPKRVSSVLAPEERINIVNEAKKSGYGALKIKILYDLSYSRSTVHRFLKKKGLTKPYGYHRRPKFQDTKHMNIKNTPTIGYLQMDVKYVTPELSGLEHTCFEYAALDIYSRYKQALILPQLDQDHAILALNSIIKVLPFKPIFVQTDNGLEFQQRFLKVVKSLGLKHHYIHKSNPNENGAIERSFRTDEDEFFFWRLKERPRDITYLNDLFQEYLYEYNYRRPHFGIDLKTPSDVVANVVRH